MVLAQAVSIRDIILVLIYLGVIGYLSYLGYRRTKTAADYMVAGRQAHPFIMALSYGATFISTSAIVGFGGVAGMFGMSLLWLTFLNIFVGIFIAFVLLGGPARRLGHRLDAHTFPELLGRRYQSNFIQVFGGLIIFLFIPLYAAAVLIGGCEFIASQFDMSYDTSLLVFSVLIAVYVVMGGMKGVMYTEALQGTIMFVGMFILLAATYKMVGGVVEGHEYLSNMSGMAPGSLKAIGHQGWTAMPEFGWGEPKYNLWWIVVSTITLGVGIGVLAQPQLVVRFMTVKSKKQLNRAVLVGGVFILVMTGVAFTVGSLSNAWFAQHGALKTGRIVKPIDAELNQYVIQVAKPKEGGGWLDVTKPDGSPALIPVVLDPEQPEVAAADAAMGTPRIVQGRSIAVVNAGGLEQIIPTYIKEAMPDWFGVVFLLTLLSAAMSTLASQFHALGTAIGRDVYEKVTGSSGKGFGITRIGIMLGIILAVVISYYAQGGMFIARGTAIFFGLCASTFLPAFLGALFLRSATRHAAIASMVTGFAVTAFWLLFVKAKEASTVGLVQMVTDGKSSILADTPNWPEVDPLMVALPLSAFVFVVVTLVTRAPDTDHVNRCFGTRSK